MTLVNRSPGSVVADPTNCIGYRASSTNIIHFYAIGFSDLLKSKVQFEAILQGFAGVSARMMRAGDVAGGFEPEACTCYRGREVFPAAP
jgi:hypothetical protein